MASKEFLDNNIYDYDDPDTEEIKPSVSDKSKKEIIEESPIIPSKPILEVKEIEENPYAGKYNKAPSKPKAKPKKRQLKQDVAVKKLISISQKNIKVVDILKNIPDNYPSDSEYICQAIIEKYERETEFKNADIKSLVRDALEELVGEKYIIMKGSSDVQVATTSVSTNTNISAPIIRQDSINQAISSQEESEKESLLLGILDDMDDE